MYFLHHTNYVWCQCSIIVDVLKFDFDLEFYFYRFSNNVENFIYWYLISTFLSIKEIMVSAINVSLIKGKDDYRWSKATWRSQWSFKSIQFRSDQRNFKWTKVEICDTVNRQGILRYRLYMKFTPNRKSSFEVGHFRGQLTLICFRWEATFYGS